MLSQILGKVAPKWPRKTVQKTKQKSTKNMKLSTLFGRFWSLNNQSFQSLRHLLMDLVFGFGHKTTGGLETWTNYS